MDRGKLFKQRLKRSYERLNGAFSSLIPDEIMDDKTEAGEEKRREVYGPFYKGIRSIALGMDDTDLMSTPFDLPHDDELTDEQAEVMVIIRLYLRGLIDKGIVKTVEDATQAVYMLRDEALIARENANGDPAAYVLSVRGLTGFNAEGDGEENFSKLLPGHDASEEEIAMHSDLVREGWLPIGTKVYCRYKGKVHVGEIVPRLEGRTFEHPMLMVLTGPAAGIVCATPTSAFGVATQKDRTTQGVSDGWQKWHYVGSELGSGTISPDAKAVFDCGRYRDEKELAKKTKDRKRIRLVPDQPVSGSVLSDAAIKDGWMLASAWQNIAYFRKQWENLQSGKEVEKPVGRKAKEGRYTPNTPKSASPLDSVKNLIMLTGEKDSLVREMKEKAKRLKEVEKEIVRLVTRDKGIKEIRGLVTPD